MKRHVLLPLVAVTWWACLPTDYVGHSPEDPRPEAGVELPDDPDDASAAGDPDVGAPDAGAACELHPERPPAFVSPAARQVVCTGGEIDRIADCLAQARKGDFPKAPSTCLETIGRASEACRSCVLTPSSASAWGPLVRYDLDIVLPNLGGCVERQVLACGAAVQNREECIYLEACPCEGGAKICPAASSACAAAEAEATECFSKLGSGSREMAQKCRWSTDRSDWRRLLAMFCGP